MPAPQLLLIPTVMVARKQQLNRKCPLPLAPTLAVVPPTCANNNGSVTVTNPTGSDYEYSNNDGAFQPGVAFTVAANATYSIKVKRLSTGCISGATTGTMGNSQATPAAAVVIQTYPDCASSTGTLKVVKADGSDFDNTIFEFSNNGTTFGSNPVFTFIAGQGYNITVRRISDHTCTATTSCAGETPQVTNQRVATSIQEIELSPEPKVTAAPNPFNNKVRFSIKSAISGQGSLDLYNMMGQKVTNVFSGFVDAGQVKNIDYNAQGTSSANLIYVFRVGDQRVTGKILRLKN